MSLPIPLYEILLPWTALALITLVQVVFLTRMTNSIFGEKALAILHGLPFALLMWG